MRVGCLFKKGIAGMLVLHSSYWGRGWRITTWIYGVLNGMSMFIYCLRNSYLQGTSPIASHASLLNGKSNIDTSCSP